MNEIIGGMVVFGLALAVVCGSILARQIGQDMRDTARNVLQANDRVLARLARLAGASLKAPAPKGRVSRGFAPRTAAKSGDAAQSEMPRRRGEDALSV